MKVIVVGGGPAGMMAAISASQHHEVTLIERNNGLGFKLRATGNTRCNITNNKSNRQLVSEIHQGKFLYSALTQFNVTHIIEFFNNGGLELKEEDNGRMFPITDSAHDVLNVFLKKLEENKVKIINNTKIIDLVVKEERVEGVIDENGEVYQADKVILAGGGVSYRGLGSDGTIHEILEKHGVHITDFYPVETSLISHEPFIQSKELQGLSIKHVLISVVDSNKKVHFKTKNDILFTHFGLSGPGILACSEHVFHLLNKGEKALLELCFVDDFNQEQFFDYLLLSPDKKLLNLIKPYLPKRMILHLFEKLMIDENVVVHTLSFKKLRELIHWLYKYQVEIADVMDINKAFVTGGGVDLKEIEPQTFKHKRLKNLSICGELLDLHGPIGGYNLTIAMVSGYVAGQSL